MPDPKLRPPMHFLPVPPWCAIVADERLGRGSIVSMLLFRRFGTEAELREFIARFDSGDVRFAGKEVRGYLPRRWWQRQSRVGSVFQPLEATVEA